MQFATFAAVANSKHILNIQGTNESIFNFAHPRWLDWLPRIRAPSITTAPAAHSLTGEP